MTSAPRRAARHLRRRARRIRAAWRRRQVLVDPAAYTALRDRVDDEQTVIETTSGLRLALRHNTWDWKIAEEQLIHRFYVRRFTPPTGRAPVIVDIGGYIGDFALWAAHELKAEVVVYEPTAENWAMLQRNLELNPDDAARIRAVNKGVSADAEVVSNVQVIGQEVHVSSEWYADDPTAIQRTFECDTLAEVLDAHGLDRVDLLKVDCEGGEYDIFRDVPAAVYARISQMVFEFHRVPDWEAKAERLRGELRRNGFDLEQAGLLVYATRS